MKIILDEKSFCIRPVGRLDASSSNELDLFFKDLTGKGQDLIIDLSECPYVSSAGIRILLQVHKKLQSNRNQLFISGTVLEVFRVFEIAGLHNVLRFETSIESALAAIRLGRNDISGPMEIIAGTHQVMYHPTEIGLITGQYYNTSAVLSYKELGFSLGFGWLSGLTSSGRDCSDFFATLGTCCAFLPLHSHSDPDFRLISDPGKTRIQVCEALSFGHRPAGAIKMNTPGMLKFSDLNSISDSLREETFLADSLILLMVANQAKNEPSLSLVLKNNKVLADMVKENKMAFFEKKLAENTGKNDYIGITFQLADLDLRGHDTPIPDFIRRNLDFENIQSVKPFNTGMFLVNPVTWLFPAGKFTDGRT